ncbi:DUF7500 family protein [Halorussus halobius]|uniref:DUF7500 family protein n=1 Tax=Halorussus halobius TaxID=1710537 RepID=UPI001FCEA39A|nr:hypothetical protein [Halorussus halobius]
MCPTPDDGRNLDEPPLPTEEAASGDDRSALSPDDLDIEDEDNVVQLDEGRFVIGTDQHPEVPDDRREAGGSDEADPGGADAGPAPNGRDAIPTGEGVDSGAVKQWLEADLEGASAKYGFHVAAKSEGAVSHQQLFSDDVGTVFDGLLRWYAQQLTTETAVEDVLGILLTESNVRVRYSPSCLQAILESYQLGPEDTIADLVEAVQDDRGMVFPPENV